MTPKFEHWPIISKFKNLMDAPAPHPLAILCLKVAIAAQCWGNAWGLAYSGESELMSLLWSPADVGGMALGELPAIIICRALAVLLLAFGTLQLLWPGGRMLLTIAGVQVILAWAMWRMHSGYPPELVMWSPLLARYLPFAAHAIRSASPIVLWLLAGGGHPRIAEWLARWAIALTFAGHGIEALVHYHQFSDMLLIAARKWDLALSQSSAESLLTVIGWVDIALAVLIVGTRWQAVAGYMAFWGLVTAASRIVVKGFYFGWDGTAIRLVHFALPLLLLLWWSRLRRVESKRTIESQLSSKK